jgi:hypothetical protein
MYIILMGETATQKTGSYRRMVQIQIFGKSAVRMWTGTGWCFLRVS